MYQTISKSASLVALMLKKESTCNAGEPGSTLGWEDPLEKGMATHSSILTWRISWAEEPGGPSSWGRKELDTTEWATLSLFISKDFKKNWSESEVAQLCPSDPMDCSLPGSSVHGVFQARVLEWGAIAFSKCHSSFSQIILALSYSMTLQSLSFIYLICNGIIWPLIYFPKNISLIVRYKIYCINIKYVIKYIL